MYNRDKIIGVMQEIFDESKSIAPYVLVAQPRRVKGEIAAQKLDGYDGLHIDFLGVSHGFCEIYGEKVDVARNYLMEQAIASGAKYLFFVGEDTVIPYDGYKRLHETAEANPGSIACGVYYIKLSNAMVMTKQENWINIANVDPGQIIDTWMCGMDAMLIPIDLLKKLKAQDPEIPFCCIGTNIGDIPFVGEDNFFIHRVHKMGAKVLVNTDVQCLHMDLATGKYTAHPSIDKKNYYTNIPVTVPLTLEDKEFIDKRWVDRLPQGTGSYLAKIKTLQEENKPVKFNMGCGQDVIDGYFGVDKLNPSADIKEDILELTLPDGCADEILASHVIEHIPQHRVVELLSKWHNTLKPDGKLVLEQPNLEELCVDFVNAKTDNEKYLATLCIYGAFVDMSQDSVEQGVASPHVWGYYPSVLVDILTQIGYTDIKVMEQQGLHPGKNFRVEATK